VLVLLAGSVGSDKQEVLMAKAAKRKAAEVSKLTAKVEKLGARLAKAEAATAKWKAEAKRLEAEAAKRAKQVKKLRKAKAQPTDEPVAPTVATTSASPTPGTPDQSWTVTRLRASAREAGVPGYSRMTKAALITALSQP